MTPPSKPQSGDPLGDLAKASSQGKPATSSTPVEPIQYFVQVGAFNSPEDAQAQRAKMALMGLDARITEREQAGRTVFRVRLGPFERQEEAEKMKTELHTGGTEAALVRVQR
jgi:cell division protein FtsN